MDFPNETIPSPKAPSSFAPAWYHDSGRMALIAILAIPKIAEPTLEATAHSPFTIPVIIDRPASPQLPEAMAPVTSPIVVPMIWARSLRRLAGAISTSPRPCHVSFKDVVSWPRPAGIFFIEVRMLSAKSANLKLAIASIATPIAEAIPRPISTKAPTTVMAVSCTTVNWLYRNVPICQPIKKAPNAAAPVLTKAKAPPNEKRPSDIAVNTPIPTVSIFCMAYSIAAEAGFRSPKLSNISKKSFLNCSLILDKLNAEANCSCVFCDCGPTSGKLPNSEAAASWEENIVMAAVPATAIPIIAVFFPNIPLRRLPVVAVDVAPSVLNRAQKLEIWAPATVKVRPIKPLTGAIAGFAKPVKRVQKLAVCDVATVNARPIPVVMPLVAMAARVEKAVHILTACADATVKERLSKVAVPPIATEARVEKAVHREVECAPPAIHSLCINPNDAVVATAARCLKVVQKEADQGAKRW